MRDRTPKRMSVRKRGRPSDEVLYAAACELFEYQSDGTLVFKKDPRRPNSKNSKVIGKKAGGSDGHGYLSCNLLGQKFKAHQIVWLLHTKEFPKLPIDHINRNRLDNRFENLRIATDLENQQNLVASTSVAAGTYKSLRSGRWCARLTYNHKKIYLGYYDTQEQANEAYKEAKRLIAQKFSPF